MTSDPTAGHVPNLSRLTTRISYTTVNLVLHGMEHAEASMSKT